MPLWLAERWGPWQRWGEKAFTSKNNSGTKRRGRRVGRETEKHLPQGPALMLASSEHRGRESLAVLKTDGAKPSHGTERAAGWLWHRASSCPSSLLAAEHPPALSLTQVFSSLSRAGTWPDRTAGTLWSNTSAGGSPHGLGLWLLQGDAVDASQSQGSCDCAVGQERGARYTAGPIPMRVMV